MSKYTEAFRRLDEVREKKSANLFHDPTMEESLYQEFQTSKTDLTATPRQKAKKWIGRGLLVAALLLVILSFVYDFVFNKGVSFRGAPFLGIIPAQEQKNIDDHIDKISFTATPVITPDAVSSDEKIRDVAAMNGQAPVSGIRSTEVQSAPQLPEIKKDFFTIQLVTYQSEKRTREKVDFLNRNGHQTFMLPKGKYFLVCFGVYADKKEAAQKLAEFKKSSLGKEYKDAYLRLIKQT